MRHEHVGRLAGQLLQTEDVDVPDVVGGAHGGLVVGRPLVVAVQVVEPLEDATEEVRRRGEKGGGVGRGREGGGEEGGAEGGGGREEGRGVTEEEVAPPESADPDAAGLDDAGVAEVVDVGRHPAAVGQLLQVVRRLVVPPDEHRQDGRDRLAAGGEVEERGIGGEEERRRVEERNRGGTEERGRVEEEEAPVVLVEGAHLLVLVGAGHAGQVRQVPRGLEVAAAQQQVDLASRSGFA